MLKIFLGDMAEAVYHPPVYFDNRYEDEWLKTPFTKAMVKDVDNSEIVDVHLVQSPVLGPISLKELSGGVKTLILMAYDNSGRIFNASACGDNCAKWILQIAQKKDLTINLRHIMDFGENGFEAQIVNTGTVVHNMREFVNVAGDYV
ncbi:DUF4869 domain-containing protein [Selenomonas sp. AE3005]|uniref:DUF4869 domain-containing protein n=1 Tax=Selenomonas sp. AE3005 TaxID=1485543 RepID=UPI0025E2A719|nr:DUF4869 domain-containing protein [Selenomonas sp. AE3005]